MEAPERYHFQKSKAWPNVPAMRGSIITLISLLSISASSLAQDPAKFDAAAAFGARPSSADVTLSPDGLSIAVITPQKGQGSVLVTLRLDDAAAKPKAALTATGDPERLANCHWVANDRLACTIYGVVRGAGNLTDLLSATRLIAVNADGSNLQQLSTQVKEFSRGYLLDGGRIIDLMPDKDGVVLISRQYLPDNHTGSFIGSSLKGLGVDLVDTRTLQVQTVEPAQPNASRYITDGRGALRVMAVEVIPDSTHQFSGVYRYLYRLPGSETWKKLGEYNEVDRSGFVPLAVDPALNVAYGRKKLDGRSAIYTVALDGSLQEQLVYSHPEVDVDDLVTIGRRNRVVGVRYVTDLPRVHYFEPELESLVAGVSRALPDQPSVKIVDSSVDERRLLLLVSRDNNAGAYYLLDRNTHQLRPLLLVREPLENVKLAAVKPITYPAADGTVIPGYLTLPPGMESAKGLPAIVLPHGGPGSRDVWGFDWLAQYFAVRGFAVLQPNFRGSTGYGDSWYLNNGFHSWSIAIGDVLDGGRWLVAQGIANPRMLGILGWSYGGYAALQAAVVDPSVFKAVVAIAPVTDLDDAKEEWRHFSNFQLLAEAIGSDPAQIRAASPARNADKIKAPVLLFHGAMDRNVSISESQHMAKSLKSAGVRYELVTWDNLDHQLDDSAARTQMLSKSEQFLRQAFGP
jgi:dipeptidyl aminopeptidase/acylaminoacyl peptidase